jgi:F-box protein 42
MQTNQSHTSGIETTNQRAHNSVPANQNGRNCGFEKVDQSSLSAHSASHQPDFRSPEAGTSNPRPGQPSVRPNAMKNRQKQLEALLKYEKRFRHTDMVGPSDGDNEPPRLSQNLHNIRQQKTPVSTNLASLMVPHVLDISQVLECKKVTWQKLNFENLTGAPTGTIFYSLVEGQNEILMFGGIEKDIHALQRGQGIQSHTVNNLLYVISPIHHLY